jgi:Raf kinase inhibitor-like YbhB/YbcL family protein
MRSRLSAVVVLLILGAVAAHVQERAASVEIVGHVVKPQPLAASAAQLQQLKAPPGFEVSLFAENLGQPRMLAVADDGSVYVTRREPGDVLVLRDSDGDGRSDQMRAAVRRPMLHGIAIDGRRVFLVSVNDIFSADIAADGTFTNVVRIVHDLPEAGQHANRTIRIGPDKYLYVSVGSTCNACDETSPENATILRVAPDGKSRQIVASGLRNTIGFDWHPDSGELFGMDHGIDWLGDEEQPEELNHIERGKQYGWPYVYASGKLNPQDEPPAPMTGEEWAKLSVNPVLGYTAHAAPMQMAFYRGGAFPAEFHGDAFVAMRGSWNRKTPSGYEVVRIRFRDGVPQKFEPFLTGFVTAGAKPSMIGRPVGIAFDRQGAMLVSDELGGRIFRVTARNRMMTSPQPEPQRGPAAVGTTGTGTREEPAGAIAFERGETRGAAAAQLTVTSPAFASGGAIPMPFTAYGEKFSPPLRWSGAPSQAKSFVLLMEDPDAKAPKPYAHWVLYNVPAGTAALNESVPTPPRLKEPRGAMQGRNSRGQVGYVGPRPPEGDPPHHYHFQLFALDATLSLPPAADRESVVKAMSGHVVARGELVGTYQQQK